MTYIYDMLYKIVHVGAVEYMLLGSICINNDIKSRVLVAISSGIPCTVENKEL